MLKVIIVLYRDILEDKDLLSKLEENVKLLKTYIGPDSLYAVITSEMKCLIDRFPDLVFIRNDNGSLKYGIYKALRKLRGNNVLVVDGKERLSLDKIKAFISTRGQNMLALVNDKWKGIGLFRVIDLDYYIRTFEEFLNSNLDIPRIFQKVKERYGIQYEVV